MKITEILDRRAVVSDLQGQTKPDLLRELCHPLAVIHAGLSEERLLQTLLDRERLGSTGLAEGVAIPHGKLKGLPKLVGSFGRSIAGVDFDALDKKPTNLFFVIFAPETAGGDHLRALARVSRLFRSVQFRESVMNAADATAIYDLIEAEDEKF
jgi:PTS system nitrogen regulatory IIA component